LTVSWSPLDRKLPRHGARDGIYVFDAHEGEAAVRIVEKYLTIPKGPRLGQPFKLEPWQQFSWRAFYGWRHRSNHMRRYKKLLRATGRHNGKSTEGAAFGIKSLIADGVLSPLVIGAGTDRENAGIIFTAASTMVTADRRLRRRLLVRAAAKRILRRVRPGSPIPGQGMYRVLAADATHSHGYHPTAKIIDDLQAQASREFMAVLDSSQGEEGGDPLSVSFMTAGFDRDTIGWEEWEHAQRVLQDPSLDEELLADLYYCDADDDFEDPATWIKANPNIGVSVSQAFIAGRVREMIERPSKRPEILRLHFNVWTEGEFIAWVPPEVWRATEGEYDEEQLAGRQCFVGVSAVSLTDLASVSYVFPPSKGSGWVVVQDTFVPEDSISKLEQRDRFSYRGWLADGWLEATEGDQRDDARIVASIDERARDDKFIVTEIAVNPRNSANIMTLLQGRGFDVVQVLPGYGQMSPAMNEAERMIYAKDELAHGGNPILGWMMGNLQKKENPDGDIKPDVEKSAGNISGGIAMLMALSRGIADEGGSSWAAV
jgi:phage terminase large subunit-like protein